VVPLRRLTPAASALAWGLQFSLLSPTIALILVEVYGASLGQVGGILIVYNAAAFVLSLVVPVYADRSGDYARPLLVSGVSGLALAVTLLLTTGLSAAAIALVALGGLAGVGMSLFWGLLRSDGVRPAAIIRVRSLFSIAWIAGPPLAAFVMGAYGPRSVLAVMAVVAACGLAITWSLVGGRRPARTPAADPEPMRVSGPLVAVVVGGFVLLQATNAASVAIMTLFVRDGLGLDVTWAGAALGLAAGLEVPALFLLGRLIGRFSSTALVASGCLAGIVYYGCMPFVTGPWALLGLQAANAYFYAVVAGVGLTWFGEVIPGAAFAAGLYATTGRLGSIVSGALVALASVSPLGYSTVFAVSAVLVAIVAALVVWAGVRDARITGGRPRPSDPGSPEEPA